MNKNKKGISLIVLVVTIVVIIILVATVLYNITDGKLFGVANESVFKNDLRVIEEEFEMFVQTKATQSVGKFEIESLNAADNGLTYNTKTNDKETNIYDVIPTAKKGYYSEFEIIKGELYYKGDVEQKLIWAKELGIGIIPYEIVDGVLISSNSNLLLLDSTGTVRIPYNVTEIASGVFNNLEGLTRVIIPGSVKKIGANAFSNNKSLQEVIMEDGIEVIDRLAFNGCSNLKNVKMTNSVKEIGTQAFSSCSNLTNITLSNSLTKLDTYTFALCKNLENITIPENVTSIEINCFDSCDNLKEVYLPASLKNIKDSIFNNCNSLNKIIVDGKNENFIVENNILYSKDKTVLYFNFNDTSNVTELTIEEGVKTLMGGSLTKFTKLKVINLPSTLNSINSFNIFRGMFDLESININEGNTKYDSDGVNIYDNATQALIFSASKEKSFTVRQGTKIISAYAFYNNTNLESITLNNDLEQIEHQAFNNTKIKELNIPASVIYLNPSFIQGSDITTVTIDSQNPNYTSDDSFIYNKNKTTLVLYLKNETSVVIPDGIERISIYAFHVKTNLQNIVIPSTVKEIATSFNYCNGLTSITIPNSVENINTSCFAFCNNLTQINIDNKKDSISGAPWGSPYGMRVVNWLR